ncbi:hypothetical protein [Vibrio hibernica]|uniref:hypothetical protein n=1 Tax=Vibrio hibernica TaxID=2587465 RepID=UPI0039AEA021
MLSVRFRSIGLQTPLLAWLELAAQDQYNKAYDSLTPAEQNGLQFALKEAYRTKEGANKSLI